MAPDWYDGKLPAVCTSVYLFLVPFFFVGKPVVQPLLVASAVRDRQLAILPQRHLVLARVALECAAHVRRVLVAPRPQLLRSHFFLLRKLCPEGLRIIQKRPSARWPPILV